ncbi:MAG: extensin family protein [Novosphingobium sp.]|nr:extensin family protein [Novosphingobium sp.]
MRRLIALLPLVAVLGACADLPRSSKRESVRQSTTTFTPRPESRQCLAQLDSTRADFTPLPDKYFGAGCSTLNAVKLANLRSDNDSLELSNLGPVTCPLANTFAGWARFGVDRAARQVLGSPLVRIETMGSYNCRNVAGTSRRSAHATANAIDVSAFVLADGRRISVIGDWTSGTQSEQQFLRIVHKSACKRFGTVLGPAYNTAHRDHFHLEFGDGSYCR